MKRILFSVFPLVVTKMLFAQEVPTDTTELMPVEVRAVRAGSRSPFAKTNLSKAFIEKQNLGQDLPFVLNSTPSTVISSDAGNGVGYTGLRIRGSDLTRINVTLNGIPYNDPESQSVYFVDLPDIASSVSSLQIQRGVGTSSNGPGAFGASLNLSTNELNDKPYASFFNTVGSFGTRRHTVKLGTGLLNNHFTVDARLSDIRSDGFIDRAASNLRSYYLSAAWMNKSSSLRLNVFSGKEKTYQAWNGIPEAKLFYNPDSLLTHYYNNLGSLYFTSADSANLFTADPRKYNGFLYKNQTDNYQQDHYQLFFNHTFSPNVSLTTAFFLTYGDGYYEEYKYNQKYGSYGLSDASVGGTVVTRTDLVRQLWLDNDLYGTNLAVVYKKAKADLTFGGNYSRFRGRHFGEVLWAAQGAVPKNYEWYRFKSGKDDGTVYGKLNYQTSSRLSFLLDLQYRSVSHRINGTRKSPLLVLDTAYQFFNPKAGIFFSGKYLNAYFSYAVANKEPNRTDYEVATGNRLPQPERLHDFEAGVEHRGAQSQYGVTLFYMLYRNQLVLTGQLNDVGDAVRLNVPKSYRTGVEIWGGAKVKDWLRIEGNLTISQNKLQNYSDYTPKYDVNFEFTGYDTLGLRGAQISFSPWLTAFGSVVATPAKNLEVSVSGKGVSKQYLDNTASEYKKINGYFVQEAQVRYRLPWKGVLQADLFFQLNNVWSKKYESNGYTYSYYYDQSLVKENFYYPMAGRAWLAGLNLSF